MIPGGDGMKRTVIRKSAAQALGKIDDSRAVDKGVRRQDRLRTRQSHVRVCVVLKKGVGKRERKDLHG